MGNKYRDICHRFLHDMIGNPVYPVEEQECVGNRFTNFWCLDWWTIEVAKCIFEGSINYLVYKPPKRLIDNPFFSRKDITETVIYKLNMLQELENSDFDRVAIIETARGLDTILVNSVKKWEQIYVYHWSDYPEVTKITEHYLTEGRDALKNIRFINKVNSVEGDFVAVSPYTASNNPDSFLSKAKEVVDNKGFLIKEVWK